MRLMFLLTLVLTFGCQAASEKTSAPSGQQPASKAQAVTGAESKEEDCDDKAKKPIEIKEDTISLGGNTGCTLDEAKPNL